MARVRWILPAAIALAAIALLLVLRQPPARAALLGEPIFLPTGRSITPLGEQVTVGSWPSNLAVSPDRKFLVVTTLGSRQFLTVLRASDGAETDRVSFNAKAENSTKNEGLYFGLDFGPKNASGETLLAAGQGSLERVALLWLSADGKLKRDRELDLRFPEGGPQEAAGVAFGPDGKTLYVASNGASSKENTNGAISVFAVESGERLGRWVTPGFPLDVACADGKVYTSSERDGLVAVFDQASGERLTDIGTGTNPTHLLASPDGASVFVANSNSDTISRIDTKGHRVVQTILVRPDAARGLPGATPLGMALSEDAKTLWVALADMNALAVVDLASGSMKGWVPTGWYPTAVAEVASRVFVTNAKGVRSRLPNDKPNEYSGKSQYILAMYEGTVSHFPIPDAKALADYQTRVLANNRLAEIPKVDALARTYDPGIEHVIYVIKENRTYDHILGDITRGNGDPELCLFPREVTPNQHALAERFLLADNFYVCAELSADGWNWSTSGQANEYVSRNSTASYSRSGRSYDFEGTNNGVAVDLRGLHDVAEAEGGYLWDLAHEHGVSMRNFGFFISQGSRPNKVALAGSTCPDFQQYDLAYADSDLWVKYGVNLRTQLQKYGRFDAPSRLNAWEREYDAFVKSGKMPQLMMVRLPRDHTAGTSAGTYSPRAMVADNDYAVGRLVEKVSKGPYWKKSAIIVLEDDAQAGFDHVDAHRSTIYVISPFVAKGTHDSRFYNTDSALRTIELLLGMPPMNQFDAIATPFRVFGKSPTNAAPFEAILPPKHIATEVNSPSAYRSADSERIVNRYQEESAPDIELNDILWGSIKGADVPRPPVRRNIQVIEEDD